MTIAFEITESGHYTAHKFFGQWTVWKQVPPTSDFSGFAHEVCIYPPCYQNPQPVAAYRRLSKQNLLAPEMTMNDESHIFAELLGDEDLLADKKVIGKAKIQGHDLTLEQFTLPEGWQEQFPGVAGKKIEAVHIHPKDPEKK